MLWLYNNNNDFNYIDWRDDFVFFYNVFILFKYNIKFKVEIGDMEIELILYIILRFIFNFLFMEILNNVFI